MSVSRGDAELDTNVSFRRSAACSSVPSSSQSAVSTCTSASSTADRTTSRSVDRSDLVESPFERLSASAEDGDVSPHANRRQ